MNRRSFIASAVAGALGASGLLRTARGSAGSQPRALTVKEWAEKYREPGGFLVPQEFADDMIELRKIYASFDGGPFQFLGLAPAPPPLSARPFRRFFVSDDNAEPLPILARRRRDRLGRNLDR